MSARRGKRSARTTAETLALGRRSFAVGEAIYSADDRQHPFVYAVSATLQVRDPDGLVLGLMEPGQFTGEIGGAIDNTVLLGRTVVIAAGARYRKLGARNEERLQGAGVSYAATELEARVCKGQEVVVVGGGNSAGQAAMFLATRTSAVRPVTL